MAFPRPSSPSSPSNEEEKVARRQKYLKWLVWGFVFTVIVVTSIFTFGIAGIAAGAIVIGSAGGLSGTTALGVGIGILSFSAVVIPAIVVNIGQGLINFVKNIYHKIMGKTPEYTILSSTESIVSETNSPNNTDSISPTTTPPSSLIRDRSFSTPQTGKLEKKGAAAAPSTPSTEAPIQESFFTRKFVHQPQSSATSPLERTSPSLLANSKIQLDYIENMAQGFYVRSKNLFLKFNEKEFEEKFTVIIKTPKRELSSYPANTYIFHQDVSTKKWSYSYLNEKKEPLNFELKPNYLARFHKVTDKTKQLNIAQEIMNEHLIPTRNQFNIIKNNIKLTVQSKISHSKNINEMTKQCERWIAIMYRCYQLKDYFSAEVINDAISKYYKTVKPHLSPYVQRKYDEVYRLGFTKDSLNRKAKLTICARIGAIPYVTDFQSLADNTSEQSIRSMLGNTYEAHPIFQDDKSLQASLESLKTLDKEIDTLKGEKAKIETELLQNTDKKAELSPKIENFEANIKTLDEQRRRERSIYYPLYDIAERKVDAQIAEIEQNPAKAEEHDYKASANILRIKKSFSSTKNVDQKQLNINTLKEKIKKTTLPALAEWQKYPIRMNEDPASFQKKPPLKDEKHDEVKETPIHYKEIWDEIEKKSPPKCGLLIIEDEKALTAISSCPDIEEEKTIDCYAITKDGKKLFYLFKNADDEIEREPIKLSDDNLNSLLNGLNLNEGAIEKTIKPRILHLLELEMIRSYSGHERPSNPLESSYEVKPLHFMP